MSLTIINPYVFATTGGGGGDEQTGVTAASGYSTLGPQSYQVCDVYQVGGSGIEVVALRMYGVDTTAHTLRLWRVTGETLEASVGVVPVNGDWVEGEITPVSFSAGEQFVVSHKATSGGSRLFAGNPTSVTINDALSYVDSLRGLSDAYPTASTSNEFVSADVVFTVS